MFESDSTAASRCLALSKIKTLLCAVDSLTHFIYLTLQPSHSLLEKACAGLRRTLVLLQDPEAAEQLQQCQSRIRGRNKKLKVFTDFHLSPTVLSFSIPVSIALSNKHRFFSGSLLGVHLYFCRSPCSPLLSLSVLFSPLCPTSLLTHPLSRSVSHSFTLSVFLILESVTTGTEMVHEAQ